MFPLFTNGALLAGLAGIAAPILIHLLIRQKSQRLRFSTIQFFVKRDEQSRRKRKLRNLLLLCARVLLFALIVLAFARPYLRNGAGAALAPRQQVIVLLDTSASMQANAAGVQQWKRAKELARRALSGLQADDRAALVTCSTRALTVSEFASPPVVAKKLADLQPGFGSGELSEGLQQVRKLLAVANPAWTSTLYVISDLQRGAAQNLSAAPLPENLEVKILDLEERFIPNAAVLDLQLQTQGQLGPHAAVASFSDENYSALAASFKLDGKEVFAGPIQLSAGASTNIPLKIPALAPGWHSAEFSIAAADGFSADDSRHAVLFVPEPINALLVETRKVARPFQEESFFVGAALNPASGTDQASSSRFAFEKIDLDSLAQKLQPQPGQPRIEFVVLPGVRQLPNAAVAALTSFVQAGGGVLLFLGDNVSANRYNTDLAALLPAQLGKIEAAEENDPRWRIAEFAKNSPVFAPFREANSGNLFLPEFTHRFGLTALPGCTVLAEFDDGVPFVVERKIGKGRVLLANTSSDTAWTDWQKHKTFVPWLHAAGTALSGRDTARESESVPNYASGGEADFELGSKKQAVKLLRPGGAVAELATDDQGHLADVPLEAPGIYQLREAGGRELRRFAVNLAPAESDLSAIAPADARQQLVRRAEPPSATLRAGLFGDASRGAELWRTLLLAALILMLAEPLVANRTLA